MKAEKSRLAWLFLEAGMIDRPTFESCVKPSAEGSKGLLDILKQDVSVQSFRDLLKMEIALPSGKKAADGKEATGSALHSALSQAVYLSNEDIKAILSFWKPSVLSLTTLMKETGVVTDDPQAVADSLGKGAAVYSRMIERGLIDSKTLPTLVQGESAFKRMNRLHLSLSLLRYNGILESQDCDEILKNAQSGKNPLLLNKEIQAFIDSEPDLPELDPSQADIADTVRRCLPASVVRQSLVLPYTRTKSLLEVVTADPFDEALIDTLSVLTGCAVVAYHAPRGMLIRRIQEVFSPMGNESSAVAKSTPARTIQVEPTGQTAAPRMQETFPSYEDVADNESAVELVSSVIEGGIQHRATDVHLEPMDGHLRVRYRIDGRLRSIMRVPPPLVLSVISRIKVMSNLDVTERRRPQDGHFSLKMGTGAFDFRVSTLPTHLGEKIVIRILDASRVMFSLEGLGMEPDLCQQVSKWISRPHGLVLVTGPTGCGKTSTLYASLQQINNDSKNIVTIEDPVEYQLDGINQVQVDANIDVNFAEGLRSILRQDPDVIMVGEIRDQETARIAMRAALTGHLVFSTLHTNTAVGAIATLGQMGIEPYMLVSAISGVISQRLVRTLCPECKKPFVPRQELLQNLRIDAKSKKKMYRAEGCAACLNTGFFGRSGVFELLPLNEAIDAAILSRKSENELLEVARQHGYRSLMENAIGKLYAGLTSPEEVLETVLVDE